MNLLFPPLRIISFYPILDFFHHLFEYVYLFFLRAVHIERLWQNWIFQTPFCDFSELFEEIFPPTSKKSMTSLTKQPCTFIAYSLTREENVFLKVPKTFKIKVNVEWKWDKKKIFWANIKHDLIRIHIYCYEIFTWAAKLFGYWL